MEKNVIPWWNVRFESIPLVRRLRRRLSTPEFLLIHTPKCAGTYLNRQYHLQDRENIASVGHEPLRRLKVSSQTKVVGLIRDPIDWYASFYFFCRRGLGSAPQNAGNFPVEHPISVFSRNGEAGLNEMIANMANKKLLSEVISSGMKANLYTRWMDDVFEFFHRTDCGYWTWTMMYHFSDKMTAELKSKQDVLREAERIIECIEFIHQERVDADVERILKIPGRPGKRVNMSPRESQEPVLEQTREIVRQLDGDIAAVLGGYSDAISLAG